MENKVIATIKNRVSCRAYTTKKVPLSKLKIIAESGMMAPSGRNRQVANILVLKSKNAVEKLRKLSLDVYGHDCFYGANTMILVHGPKNEAHCIQDCSCILENMFIAATALKINSCWINQAEDLLNSKNGEKVRKYLNIPTENIVVGTCILGYSSEENIPVKPRKDNFIKIV